MSSNVYLSQAQIASLQQAKTYVDPVAQSFIVDSPGGAFLTSIDLYFASKDSTLPVTLEIREMENGIPTGIIVPFSTVTVNAADVTTSSNASVATKFTFSAPVFLIDTKEYCFVVNANSRNYKIWVAETGKNDVTNTAFSITKQPYAGVMFKSQNSSTWIPEQNLDIKFLIRRAEFAAAGDIILNEAPIPVVTLDSNPLYTYSGTKNIRVFHKDHGHFAGSSEVTIAGLVGATSYNGILGSEINGTHTVVSVEQDSYTIQVTAASNASASGRVGGSAVTATENRVFDVLYPTVQQLSFKNTQANWFVRTTSGQSLAGSEIPHSLSQYYQIPVNQNVEMNYPQVVRAVNTASPTTKSFYLKGSLSTSQTTLSPVIDLNRTSAIAINYRLDRPIGSAQTGYNVVENYQSETVGTGSSALSKYITRRVDLATAASALRIFLSTNRPTGSYIDVYYKVTDNIDANFDALPWYLVNPIDSVPITDNAGEYTDVEYAVTEAASGISNKKFVAFAIKIVFTATNSAAAPSCSDLRAIAVT
jgi:hypothetical protein